MTDAGGGFYSAEDADSVIDPAQPDVKGEGAFYIWTAEEIRDAAGQPAADWFCYRYGVAEGGNVDQRSARRVHGQEHSLPGAHRGRDRARTSAGRSRKSAPDSSDAARILLAARAQRVRPHLDDKILTAWNGLMISAFALGGAVLDEPRYAEAARRAAEFLIDQHVRRRDRHPAAPLPQGDAAIPGFLDDYAFFAQGLLDLYEAQFDRRHLELAVRLTEKQRELFEDREHGGFFSTAGGRRQPGAAHQGRLRRRRASGNSVAAAEPAAAGADHRPRRLSRNRPSGRWRPSPAPVGWRRWRCRRCWWPASSCWASRARSSSWASATRADTRALLARAPSSFRPQPDRAAGGFRGDPRRRWPRAFPPIAAMEQARRPRRGVRLPQLHLPVARFRSRPSLPSCYND